MIIRINICWYCSKLQLGVGLCGECWQNIVPISANYCPLCANIYAYGICALCNLKIQVLFKYGRIISKLILRLKYNHFFYISDFFIYHISHTPKNPNYHILYVPHYKWKQITTSVNSSLLLAHSFQRLYGGRIIHDVLIKKSKSRQKDSKSYEERYNKPFSTYDIQNAHILTNEDVILIDDVITTGSTITRCAHLIQKYQPKSLKVILIAQVCA